MGRFWVTYPYPKPTQNCVIYISLTINLRYLSIFDLKFLAKVLEMSMYLTAITCCENVITLGLSDNTFVLDC